MKKVFAFLALLILLTPIFAQYSIGDGICERDRGESCFESQDCLPCRVKIKDVKIERVEGIYRIAFEVCNDEPRDWVFVVEATDNGNVVLTQQVRMASGECKGFKYYAFLEGGSWIRVMDTKKELIYAYKEIGEKKPSVLDSVFGDLAGRDLLMIIGFPSVVIIIFFLLTFFPRKKKVPLGGFSLHHPQVYAPPPTYFPEWHGEYQVPVIEIREIVVVPKRKVYYVRKDKK